jgi:uncharacterized membrane protein
MTWYEFLLYVHVSAVVIWVGAGFLVMVLAIRADRSDDVAQIKRLLDDNTWLATHLFIPSSLVVVAAGIWLAIDGPWTFDQLWIVLGLLGYALTFLTGVTILRPRGDRVAAMLERDGGRMTPTTLAETRRLLALARIDYVTLFLVILDMTAKPTGDDVGLLIVMAAIFAGGVFWTISTAQSIQAPGEATV